MNSKALFVFTLVLGVQVFGVFGDDHTIATSVCVGLAPERTYTAAIPRDCNSRQSCNEICRSVADMDVVNDASKPRPECIDALHIYADRGTKNTANTKWVNTWRYGSKGCRATHCGPNFCCCSQ
ncbi:uncharacterized protein [Magallana gigas]|uniref:uncharacterized protein n=1 Tax=Magallana gigas TaxID=29159 RepID=UPI00333F617F